MRKALPRAHLSPVSPERATPPGERKASEGVPNDSIGSPSFLLVFYPCGLIGDPISVVFRLGLLRDGNPSDPKSEGSPETSKLSEAFRRGWSLRPAILTQFPNSSPFSGLHCSSPRMTGSETLPASRRDSRWRNRVWRAVRKGRKAFFFLFPSPQPARVAHPSLPRRHLAWARGSRPEKSH